MRRAEPAHWLATITAACLLASSGAAGARDFRAADTQAEDYPTVQALQYMDRLIAERSQARHRIRVFHSRQLGEEKETIEQTRVGAIDLNRTNIAPLGSFVPEANVLAMPFLFRSHDHLDKVLAGPIGQQILTSFYESGLIGLAYYESGARSFYNSVRPIRTPADMKGLRIRVQQSDVMIAMVKALGARPIALPYGQVLTGLTTKLIDGAENNWPSYVTTNHYIAARYYTLTEHTVSPEVLLMSRRAWDALTPEDQQMFRAAAIESSRFMRAQWKSWEDRSRERAKRAGNEIDRPTDRMAFERAVSGIYERMQSDPKIGSLIERIRETK